MTVITVTDIAVLTNLSNVTDGHRKSDGQTDGQTDKSDRFAETI